MNHNGYILNVHGGGHQDSSFNGMMFYDFSGTTLPTGWEMGAYTEQANQVFNADAYADGKPSSVHTYGGMVMVGDRSYRFGGVPWSQGITTNASWRYTRSTQQWVRLADLGFSSGFMHCMYNAAANKILVGANNQCRFLNLATEVYSAIKTPSASGGAIFDAYACGAWDTTRSRGVFAGHQSGVPNVLATIDWSAETVTLAALSASGETECLTGGISCFYDSVRDSYWLFGGNVSNFTSTTWPNLYEMNASTFAITKTALTGDTIEHGDIMFGSYGRFVFMPEARAIGTATWYTKPAYVIKLPGTATPDTTPPTTPGSPSATAVSQSQINVSWSASTDDVGVSNYRVERCSGTSCSNFGEIGQTTGTTFNDTGLSASTLYRYRIRAVDAALNFSSYSSTVQATTNAPDVTAPTDPSNLAGTPVSTNQINLTWDASTDAVGVDRYRVERAQGAAGSFSEISQPQSTSYSDVGLAQATLYRHRVRAADLAGNLSGYSNITSVTTNATTIRNAGTGQTYSTISAAVAAATSGDVIEVSAGDYHDDPFTIPGTLTNLTIRGLGGVPRLIWGTGNYRTNGSTYIANGKGYILIKGANTVLEDLEILGAKVADENGAGIRYDVNTFAGGNLTCRRVYIHDCENGVLGEGRTVDTLLIEYSRFATNGYCPSSCAHNIYIGLMGTLIFRFNSSINSEDGHCLKSRAQTNEVYANHFSTKDNTGSFEAEFPNGNRVYFVGNVIEQGDDTNNSTILSYGAEGISNPFPDELYVINNTFYNWRSAGCTFIGINGTPSVAVLRNNARSVGGTFRSGSATTLTESNNVALSDSAWVDVDNADFHLTALATTAIGQGVNPGFASTTGYSLSPEWEYVATANRTARNPASILDVGAYGYTEEALPKAIAFSRRS